MGFSVRIAVLAGAALLGVAFSTLLWGAAEPAAAPPRKDASPPARQSPAPGGAQETEASQKPEPADNSYCYACHANYKKEQLTKVHQLVGVGCETCHGPSIQHSGDEDGLIPPDKMFAKSEINAYCMTCHEKKKLTAREEHRGFFKEAAPDGTCSACHGEHHRLTVRTRVWDKKTRQLIKDDGVRMMEERTK